MSIWKKFLGIALLFITTPFQIPAQCAPAYDCYDWDPCALQGLTLEGGVIWWKASIDNLDFGASVYNDDNIFDVDYAEVCPDWELGFRVAASYQRFLCDWTLGASWTHYRPDESHTITASDDGFVISPLFHPVLLDALSGTSEGLFDSVKGKYEGQYNDWDVLLFRDMICGPCHRLTPYFGLAGLRLDQLQKVSLKSSEEAEFIDKAWIKWESEYRGIGLRAGSIYEYKFHPCIGFFVNTQASVVVGESSFENKQKVVYGEPENPTTEFIELEGDDSCHIVPGYHLFTGFVYYARYWESNFILKIGYEFVTWFNLSNPSVYSGSSELFESSHSTPKTTRTIGFQGLFATLALRF